ncbi:uncharacterized protein LOC106660506 [Trichogramma pretiosum]|uniref:uncharacterized protein LOC106660506 n=1 Tax=Trichogramma pretiosum TaxID=7493 RepID=UPI0006C95DE5|nr:uncharacterized protein LOC106660506 [Trichogramma pretiosum]
MSFTAEDVLEDRIAELEKRIYGLDMKKGIETSLPDSSIIDNYNSAYTLITSALSGREKINSLIQRLPELESFTETDFEPSDLNTDMKVEYILAVEPEIRQTVEQFNQLKELLSVLDSNSLSNLPEMEERLHKVSLKYIEIADDVEQVNSETREMISRYNEIMLNISKTLIILDDEVSKFEKAAEPKKILD